MRDTSNPEVAKLFDAEIVERSANGYTVQLDDGSIVSISTTPMVELLFETDLLDLRDNQPVPNMITASGIVDLSETDTVVNGEKNLTVSIDTESQNASIELGSREVSLQPERVAEVIQTITQYSEEVTDGGNFNLALTGEIARRLQRLFNAEFQNQVRADQVRKFLSGFPDHLVQEKDDGWVVCEAFLVDWSADNHVFRDAEGSVMEESYQADNGDVFGVKDDGNWIIDYSLTSGGQTTVNSPTGEPVHLTEAEAEFLGSVAVLTQSSYVENAGESTKLAQTVASARSTGEDRDVIAELRALGDVDKFRDHESGLIHHHGIDKHTLTSTFNVKNWVIGYLRFSEYDHGGLHELSAMEPFLRNHDRDPFYDGLTQNEVDERWANINSSATHRNAPCPDWVYETIRKRHE